MGPEKLTATKRPKLERGEPSVLIVFREVDANAVACLRSVLESVEEDVPVVVVAADAGEHSRLQSAAARRTIWVVGPESESESESEPAIGEGAEQDPMTAIVARALDLLAPADVALLVEPCRVEGGWLERMALAARADTNTATASALTVQGGPLALRPRQHDRQGPSSPAADAHSAALWPRLDAIVGPCMYLRREALELVGPLDAGLPLRVAVERRLAVDCRLAGLSHVAADEVVVERLSGSGPTVPAVQDAVRSPVLDHALARVRGREERLSVTVDARALGGAMNGTQIHLLELVAALARTGSLDLRLLVLDRHAGADSLAPLRELPHTEILWASEVTHTTPRSAIFHRPQQTFAADDVRLAFELGERFVLTQLDLIAYDNPGYCASGAEWERARRANRLGLLAADRVVVLSQHTGKQLVGDALVEAERIAIVAPGLDHGELQARASPTELPAGHEQGLPAISQPFLLCLGADFRHKNRLFALRLFEALRRRYGFEGKLVFAGAHVAHGSSAELECDFLRRRPELAEAVMELGPVAEHEKRPLMQAASLLLYPSAYEGFGLVPFESALLGVPCAFAAQASLAEVAPTSAAAIVPWDVDASAARVNDLLVDPRERAAHVRALAGAARELTWQRAASEMLAVYRSVALAPVRPAVAVTRDAAQAGHEADAQERTLVAAHDELVARLVQERAHAQGMYDDLNERIGWGLALVGPEGRVPQDVQRLLLALVAHRGIARLVFAPAGAVYRVMRALGRLLRPRRGR